MAPPSDSVKRKENFVQWTGNPGVKRGEVNTSPASLSSGSRGRGPLCTGEIHSTQPGISRGTHVPARESGRGNSTAMGRSSGPALRPDSGSSPQQHEFSVQRGLPPCRRSAAPGASTENRRDSISSRSPSRHFSTTHEGSGDGRLGDDFMDGRHRQGPEERHVSSGNTNGGRPQESSGTRSPGAPFPGRRSSLQIGTGRTGMGSRSEVGGSSTVRDGKISSRMNARRYSGGEERSRETVHQSGEYSAGSPIFQRGLVQMSQRSPAPGRSKNSQSTEERRETTIAFDDGMEEENRTMDMDFYEEEMTGRAGGSGLNRGAVYSFYGNEDVDMTGESEGREEEPGSPEETPTEYGNKNAALESALYPTESEKRRERRQDLAARRREGDRRRADGLPRNYLLVDEYTREPYGQGIGSWRKEMMLLSRQLDPAVGNINRQPEDAVKEIGEWIQQTWEYSRPIKWEFVKEVIARGVSLRRSELWKRIRMGGEKPDGVSDRSWRSLQRELHSPAMMKKFENCSKANASRHNFGRTGPSGEVGVRERLRKRLKRSPSPSEVRVEMERPKGYSGRSKRQNKVDYIMHGNGETALIVDSTASLTNGSGENGDYSGEDCNPMDLPDKVMEGPEDVVGVGGRELNTVGLSAELSLSEEQVSQHPAFLRLLQRLEALEKRGSASPVDEQILQDDNHDTNPESEKEERAQDVPQHDVGPGEAPAASVGLPVRRSSRSQRKGLSRN